MYSSGNIDVYQVYRGETLIYELQRPFIITMKTTTANETITIPTTGGGYNYKVENWGDGTSSASGLTGNAAKTYTSAGTYQIQISGVFPRIYFNNNADAIKLLSVDRWGIYGTSPTQDMAFRGCKNLVSVANDMGWINNSNSLIFAFRDTNFSTLPSIVTCANSGNMYGTFQDAKVTYYPINFNQPLATTFRDCFRNNPITDMPDGFRPDSMANGTGMFFGVTLNTARYSKLLQDIRDFNIRNGFTLTGGNSKFNAAGLAARNTLTSAPRNLIIIDNGLE